jgi:hypothetical protein
MKNIHCLFLFFVFQNSFSQSDTLVKKFDEKLIGSWKGSEVDRKTLENKLYWFTNRFDNGTYIIMLTSVKDCNVKCWIEKGIWWTNNGKFYKLNARTDILTTYNYESTGVSEIFFSIKPSDAKVENEDAFYFENLLD